LRSSVRARNAFNSYLGCDAAPGTGARRLTRR